MIAINYGAIATEWNRGGARRALAELKRQGYVIVPVEPTAEMVAAGWDGSSDATVEDIYSAMIAIGGMLA